MAGLMRALVALGLAGAASLASAATVTPASAAPGSLGGQVLQMVLGLLAVLGLIFVMAWLLRRVQGATPQRGQVIEILGSRTIGPRDRLLLVQVGKAQILLGHSPGTIEALHVLDEPVEVPANARQATPEFAQRLMELMGKDHKDKT